MNNDFLKLKNVQYALYGASSGGQECYTYLKGLGLEDSIVCFIDRDTAKHGGGGGDFRFFINMLFKTKIFCNLSHFSFVGI
jgi:hypothetical protein